MRVNIPASVGGCIMYRSAGIQRALQRLAEVGLYLPARGEIAAGPATELLGSAVRFIVPAKFVGKGAGTPTAWYVGELAGRLHVHGAEIPVVWGNDEDSGVPGIMLEPIDAVAPELAERDARVGGLLRAVDAVRIGGAREREVAAEYVRETIQGAQW